MAFPSCLFGFALIVVFSTVQSSAKDLPSAGLLDEMPKNCIGKHYCQEMHENYPQAKIDQLLTKKFQITLGNVHEDFGHRGVTEMESQNDCKKRLSYDLIYEIIDQNDNVRVVVQSDALFKQQLRIEWCESPGRLNSESIPDHFSKTDLKENVIKCVDKYIDYNFLVLTRDGEGLESVKSKFGIPMCCSCKLDS